MVYCRGKKIKLRERKKKKKDRCGREEWEGYSCDIRNL